MPRVLITNSAGYLVGDLHVPETIALSADDYVGENCVSMDTALRSGFPIYWYLTNTGSAAKTRTALEIPPSSALGGMLLQQLASMIGPILRKACPRRLPSKFSLQCMTDAHGTLICVFAFAERTGDLVARGGCVVPWQHAASIKAIKLYLDNVPQVVVSVREHFSGRPPTPGPAILIEVLKQQKPRVPDLPGKASAPDPVAAIMGKIKLPK